MFQKQKHRSKIEKYKDMSKFRPVLYFMFKKDLAKKYNVSVKTLTSWINSIIPLRDALNYYGYSSYDKVLTPKQIEVIFEYISEPDEFYGITSLPKEYYPIARVSKQALLNLYHTTAPTFYRILSRHPELYEIQKMYQTNSYFSPRDVESIFSYLGHPYQIKKKTEEI